MHIPCNIRVALLRSRFWSDVQCHVHATGTFSFCLYRRIHRPAATSVVRVRPSTVLEVRSLLLFPELSVAIKTLEEEEEGEGRHVRPSVRPSVRQTAAALNKHAQRTFTPPARSSPFEKRLATHPREKMVAFPVSLCI